LIAWVRNNISQVPRIWLSDFGFTLYCNAKIKIILPPHEVDQQEYVYGLEATD